MTKANLKRLDEGKLYYSISEVCSMTGLEQHVLRYWETEFPQLRPKKNRSGNRAYRGKEIKIIRYIKYLLYEELFTIPGAKRKMSEANMSDLDGQLSLIRVAPDPQTRSQPLHRDEAGADSASIGSVLEAAEARGNGSNGHSHSGPGSEADARLREEVVRLKHDLEALLALLDGRGRNAL